MHIYNKIHVLIITFSPICFGAYCAIFRENFFVCCNYCYSFEHIKKFSLEDGVISAETCRRKGDN